MQRFKIVLGVTLMVLLVIIAVASKEAFNESELATPTPTSTNTIIEEEKAQGYLLRQEKMNDALSAYFEKAIHAGTIIGAGVSIVKGDSIVVSAGYGKRDSSEKGEVDGETVFRLGSLSKGFAGVLAADLKAEGKIDWDDCVRDYIPDFQLGDEENTAKITISSILSHSSGAPYHSFTNLVEAGLPMAKIAGRFNEVTPQNVPGKQYSYQNAIFALSQEIVQKATGRDIKTALQNRFFTPLNMLTVSMDHKTLTESENVALPHGGGGKGWRSLPLKNRYYNAVVAGGIDASSLDMAKWMRFLLGRNPGIMTKAEIAEVFHRIITLRHNNKYYQRWDGHLQSYYGHGWRIHEFETPDKVDTYTIWHHGGSVNNYRNEIAIFPESDLGICILLNSNSKLASTAIPDLYALVKRIYD